MSLRLLVCRAPCQWALSLLQLLYASYFWLWLYGPSLQTVPQIDANDCSTEGLISDIVNVNLFAKLSLPFKEYQLPQPQLFTNWLHCCTLDICVWTMYWHLHVVQPVHHVTIVQPCVACASLVFTMAWILPPIHYSSWIFKICWFSSRGHSLLGQLWLHVSLTNSHGDPTCFLMSLAFIFTLFFFFFFLCWSSLSAIDVCLLSSVTTKVNLSLQSLLDQLWWWLTLCRSADVSLGFPFLVQTGPLIGPSMYCQHQNPYSSQPCNSQYYSITCTTHYSAIIDSTNPVKFPNPANLTVRPEKLALVSCLPSFYPGWSWLAAHMIYELA